MPGPAGSDELVVDVERDIKAVAIRAGARLKAVATRAGARRAVGLSYCTVHYV